MLVLRDRDHSLTVWLSACALDLDLIEAEERRWNLWQHIEEEVMFVFIGWWAEDDRGIGRFGVTINNASGTSTRFCVLRFLRKQQ